MRHILVVAASAVLLMGMVVSVAPPASSTPRTFSGTNGRIAFQSNRSGKTEIYSILPNGSSLTRLTHTQGQHESFEPDWSPDGRTIAFFSDRTGSFQIYVMKGDGSHIRQLTRFPKAQAAFDPAFAPDGGHIVFDLCGRSGCGIWIMDSGGSSQSPLTSIAGVVDQYPEFSPDGFQIAFQRATSAGNVVKSAIYTMQADGSHVRRITPFSLQAGNPDYSPDGLRIAFWSNVAIPHSSIFTIRPDGTGLRRLTDPPSNLNDAFPVYSPLGDKIVFTSDRSGSPDIWVMRADGTHLRSLVVNPNDDRLPDWGAQVVP